MHTRAGKSKRMKKHQTHDLQRQQICDTAARIIHEDGIRDYHKAKIRACQTLHIKTNALLPTNEEIELAVKRRVQLFTRPTGPDKLQIQLSVAADMLNILHAYHPRATGTLFSGIQLKNMPVEIHAFSNSAELIIEELNWRGITSRLVEKRYRHTNAQYEHVPLITCRLDDVDIEISVFEDKALHRSPVCPTNGKVYKRVSLSELNALMDKAGISLPV